MHLKKKLNWTILNREFGSTYAVITMGVIAAQLGGGEAAAGGYTKVVIQKPDYMPPVLQ